MENPAARYCLWCGDLILLYDGDIQWVHARTLDPDCHVWDAAMSENPPQAVPSLHVIEEEAL